MFLTIAIFVPATLAVLAIAEAYWLNVARNIAATVDGKLVAANKGVSLTAGAWALVRRAVRAILQVRIDLEQPLEHHVPQPGVVRRAVEEGVEVVR